MYSGLLECPLTTRLTKVIDGAYSVVRSADDGDGACAGHALLTFQECFHAAAATLSAAGANSLRFTNTSGEDAARPAGCSVTADPAQPLLVHTFYNKLGSSTAACAGASAAPVAGASEPAGLGGAVRVSVSLDAERTDRALNLLSAIAAVDTMPKGDDRIARLHARLRARLSDVAVVSL